MNSPRANHFGNPLITATVGSIASNGNHNKAPASPGSTFSKNDMFKAKIANKHSIEHLSQHQQNQPLLPRRGMSSSPVNLRQPVSPNTSFTEREPLSTSSQCDSSSTPLHAQHEASMLLGSTITTASTIGLPSHYPGSAGHNRISSLESSVLLEELQDFDDIFGQGQSSTANLMNHESDGDGDNERDYSSSRIQYDYDDDDDLHALTRSLPVRLTLQHKRNVSELSSTSLNIPSLVSQAGATESSRSHPAASSICSNGSNHRSVATISVSSTRSHRRSRNLAMGSKEFQNAVLEELDNKND